MIFYRWFCCEFDDANMVDFQKYAGLKILFQNVHIRLRD